MGVGIGERVLWADDEGEMDWRGIGKRDACEKGGEERGDVMRKLGRRKKSLSRMGYP